MSSICWFKKKKEQKNLTGNFCVCISLSNNLLGMKLKKKVLTSSIEGTETLLSEALYFIQSL